MSPNIESYEHPLHQIARLIAPKATPPWLAAFLEWWVQGLVVDCMRDGIRPTRNELRGRLDALRGGGIANSARVIGPFRKGISRDRSSWSHKKYIRPRCYIIGPRPTR